MTFQSVSIYKNLEVAEGINGIEIPGPRVVNIYDNLTNVYAPHTFSSSIKIAQLNVMKSLNGLAANEIPGMSILSLVTSLQFNFKLWNFKV